ncbi:FHA domain-containing protein [Rothia kristinae]|nr:FHA domain-containing protein [Rothia kristinae]
MRASTGVTPRRPPDAGGAHPRGGSPPPPRPRPRQAPCPPAPRASPPRVPSSRRGAARAQAAAAAADGCSGAGAVRRPEAAPRPQPVLDINGQRFTLRAPSVVLGRSSAADITVEDTGVSRRHLEILHQDGVYLAVDLGSTNGSTVDGERLQGRRELTDGSVITMGRTTIVFRLLTPRSGTAWPQS